MVVFGLVLLYACMNYYLVLGNGDPSMNWTWMATGWCARTFRNNHRTTGKTT
jgi:hypothetical protein